MRVVVVLILSIGGWCGSLTAQGRSVESTPHNLSVSGPGEVRSTTETQVCKFCHVPHSAYENAPLWGHALSDAVYRTPKVSRKDAKLEIAQPDGSSRLCLSCHDGTVALGDLGGGRIPLPMRGGGRLQPGRKGFLGTDLSGGHPVSVSFPAAIDMPDDHEMGFRPIELIEQDSAVRLDKDGKVQCTSCHDPHSDTYYVEGKVPHFFVKPSVTEACLVCHELR